MDYVTQISKSKVASWAIWDWGSAAFNAVATTFVFSVYLTSDGLFASKDVANQYLSWGMTAAGIAVAVMAPASGRRADDAGRGVRSVGIFSLLVFFCLAAMYFVTPGSRGMLVFGVVLLGLGNIFFEFASVNYNGMLNYVSTPRNRGLISGIGWGAGYLGGIVLLLILYFGFINPEVGWFGVTSENGMDVRVSMLIAAAWFGLSALPVLLNPPTGYGNVKQVRKLSIADTYREVFRSIASLWKESRATVRFLIASAVFRDGLAGVFTFGGVLAASVFGFTPSEVIIFAIAANVVAGISTIAMGKLDDVLGPKLLISVSLLVMVIAAVMVFILHQNGQAVFWTLGLLLCVFVGPCQSASRSMLARMIPAGREGEIFGLYATTGRAVSFLAPLAYGLAITFGKLFSPDPDSATAWGILGIAFVLLLGLLLLLAVPTKLGNGESDDSAGSSPVPGGAFPH